MRRRIQVWAIARDACRALLHDEVSSTAAGVAFFVLLAVFPGLAALISLIGVVFEPHRVDALREMVSGVLPQDAAEILIRQINRLARSHPLDEGGRRVLALAPYFGFALLVWSANRGTKAIFQALNMIYGREEERGFLAFTLVTLGFTLAALAFLVLTMAVVLGVPPALDIFGIRGSSAWMLALLRWPVLLLVIAVVVGVIYRFGPSGRHPATWRSVALGSLVAAVLWIGGSVLFSWAIGTFGGLDEIYGSLSAMIAFMIWLWLSTIAVLVGAEIDAAAERWADRV